MRDEDSLTKSEKHYGLGGGTEVFFTLLLFHFDLCKASVIIFLNSEHVRAHVFID